MGAVECAIDRYLDSIDEAEAREARYQNEIDEMFDGTSNFKTMQDYLVIILNDGSEEDTALITGLVASILEKRPQDEINGHAKELEQRVRELLDSELELREEFDKYEEDLRRDAIADRYELEEAW